MPCQHDRTAAPGRCLTLFPSRAERLVGQGGISVLPVPDHPTVPFILFHVLILVCHGASAAVTIAMADLGKIKQGRAERHRPRQLGNLPEKTSQLNDHPLLNCFIRLAVPGYQVFHRLRPPDHQVSARSTVTAALLISTDDQSKGAFKFSRARIEAYPPRPSHLPFVIDSGEHL